MSLFQCEQCGCVDNTATSNYWFRNDKSSACKGQKLCSACDPDLKKWHGVFKRMYLPKGEFHTNQQGNLTHTASDNDDYRTFMIKECAAQVRGLACRHPRAEHSLFCTRHKFAANRIHLFVHVSNDALAQMMQRDGEQQ